MRSFWFTALAAVGLVISEGVAAQTVDICKQVSQSINHPATFATDKIQQCSKKWTDFLTPDCCLPGWQAKPRCYIAKQRTVREAWTELKQELRCDPKDIQSGVREFAQWFYDPKMIALQPAKGLIDLFEATQAILLNMQATRVPDDIRDTLTRMAGSTGVLFSSEDIERARWLSHSNEAARPYMPQAAGNHQDSITYGHIILAGPQMLASIGCDRVGYWAHEITHVHQYGQKGYHRFLADYLAESTATSYENLSHEKEAQSVEDILIKACTALDRAGITEVQFKNAENYTSFVTLDGTSSILIKSRDSWREYNGGKAVFIFKEKSRDQSNIYLHDASRDMDFIIPRRGV